MSGNITITREEYNNMLEKMQQMGRLQQQLLIQKKIAEEAGEAQEQAENELNEERKLKYQHLTNIEAQNRQLLNKIAELEQELLGEKEISEQRRRKLQILEENANNQNISAHSSNDSLLLEYEGKISQLKSDHKSLEEHFQNVTAQKLELEEKIQNLEVILNDREMGIENLRGLVECQQNEIHDSKQQIRDLELQLHSQKSEPNFAPQGNSLFAQVHDGKIKLEADLLKLYKDNEKLRRDLSKALRLVYKNSLSKNSAIGGDFLAGPTLDVFKSLKDELIMCLSEKRLLLNQIHKLEEQSRKELKQKNSSTNFSTYNELLNQENLRAKHRSEQRLMQQELKYKDCLDALAFEKERARKCSVLENEVTNLKELISHYEKNLLKGGEVNGEHNNVIL